jgi:preprotein translocase subunit SecD
MTEEQVRERQDFAIQQNTITLRNRVNELGVAEPVVQRQGADRIVVQLPGVQDPRQAERRARRHGDAGVPAGRHRGQRPVRGGRRGRAPINTELYTSATASRCAAAATSSSPATSLTGASAGFSKAARRCS